MNEGLVVRFYTQARKIPALLGKIGNWNIPGGPYTATQGVVFLLVSAVGKFTMPIWAGGMLPLIAWALLLVVAGGIGYLAGLIPMNGRNPFMLLLGVLGYADAPPMGSQRGRPVRLGRTHTVRRRTSLPTTTGSAAEPTPVREAEDLEQEEAQLEVPLADSTDSEEAERVPVESLEREAVADGPSPHQLNEVQQLLAASAQRR
ncbi:hypothetical protein [Brachybacterium kimchii]|uniref:Uncharacterized protein n=1 Tax=Brachybacterium kimchii TaxID=2942909 RepID=A0ABY4NDU2_9MICO|nr:hypothetical protein [Brachybacterium kimchii]UQN31810.1 hypothetical protein M4486_19665 [Brachybacterium kimchii]